MSISAVTVSLPQKPQSQTQDIPIYTLRSEALFKRNIDKSASLTCKKTVTKICTTINSIFYSPPKDQGNDSQIFCQINVVEQAILVKRHLSTKKGA